MRFNSNNALEFHYIIVTFFHNNNGITQTTNTTHQPQSKSRAERINRTLMNLARSSLSQNRLSSNYWDHKLIYATYKYNQMPHRCKKTSHYILGPEIEICIIFSTYWGTWNPCRFQQGKKKINTMFPTCTISTQ